MVDEDGRSPANIDDSSTLALTRGSDEFHGEPGVSLIPAEVIGPLARIDGLPMLSAGHARLPTLSRLEDIERQDRRDPHVRYIHELPDSQIYGNGRNDVCLCLRIAVPLGDVVDHLQQGVPRRQ